MMLSVDFSAISMSQLRHLAFGKKRHFLPIFVRRLSKVPEHPSTYYDL